nr:matrix metalloproteinase-24-like isoform X1 [Anas platyrhynchos]
MAPRRCRGLAAAGSLLLCALLRAAADSSTGRSWLKTYGYLLPSDSQMSALQAGKAVQSAVATMQQFYGIPVTGVLDQTTLEWMKKPRCGVPDHPHLGRSRRKKRYALTGQKWRQKHITYSVHNYTPKVGELDTRRAIRQAFDVWQRVTPLTFEEVPYHEIKNDRKEADIMIFFASGFHGDSSPFDGEGGFLAHAYFPGPGIGGDTHFDSDEPWTLGNSNHDGRLYCLLAAQLPELYRLLTLLKVSIRIFQSKNQSCFDTTHLSSVAEDLLSERLENRCWKFGGISLH